MLPKLLEQRQIEPTEELVTRIFDSAKKADRLLSDEELLEMTR